MDRKFEGQLLQASPSVAHTPRGGPGCWQGLGGQSRAACQAAPSREARSEPKTGDTHPRLPLPEPLRTHPPPAHPLLQGPQAHPLARKPSWDAGGQAGGTGPGVGEGLRDLTGPQVSNPCDGHIPCGHAASFYRRRNQDTCVPAPVLPGPQCLVFPYCHLRCLLTHMRVLGGRVLLPLRAQTMPSQ